MYVYDNHFAQYCVTHTCTCICILMSECSVFRSKAQLQALRVLSNDKIAIYEQFSGMYSTLHTYNSIQVREKMLFMTMMMIRSTHVVVVAVVVVVVAVVVVVVMVVVVVVVPVVVVVVVVVVMVMVVVVVVVVLL